jgi:uncharacterized protein DUF4386
VEPIKKAARVAGFLYLLVVVTGLFSLVYVPGKLMVVGNPAATAANILASQSLFEIHILNGLVSTLLFLFVALALYRLLKDVNPSYAAVMVILVLVQIPLGIGEVLNEIAALDLLRGDGFWSAFDKPQQVALAMSLLDPNNRGTSAVEMLWGLWLLPLGLLVFRSRFLPRWLGVWLGINGLAYVAMSCVGILWPQYSKALKTIAFPALLGEVALTLWLLIVGARPKPIAATASVTA